MDLLIASGNRGKLREIEAALGPLGFELATVASRVPGFDPEETGESFLENARLKAAAGFAGTGEAVLADDSGLCVVGLDGGPGVRSARFGGLGLDDRGRIDHLLQELAIRPQVDRTAWFACVMYAILPRSRVHEAPGVTILAGETYGDEHVGVTCEGRLMGRIGTALRGSGGFGYDPVFYPDADPERALAEFSMAEKNRISHRGQALAMLHVALRCD